HSFAPVLTGGFVRTVASDKRSVPVANPHFARWKFPCRPALFWVEKRSMSRETRPHDTEKPVRVVDGGRRDSFIGTSRSAISAPRSHPRDASAAGRSLAA